MNENAFLQPSIVIFIVGTIAQAAITWFRVGALEESKKECETRCYNALEALESRVQKLEQFRAAQDALAGAHQKRGTA